MSDPILGIDAGSVSASAVVMAPDGRLLDSRYEFHQGLIRETLARLLGSLRVRELAAVACTSSTPRLLRQGQGFDSQVSYIAAARHFHGRLGSLLVVGGERFARLSFDGEGGFESLKGNSSCAAGTGSFLDQQARRLGLSGSAELAERAVANRGQAPTIASRCSVFAKTDLCHAQQAGFTLEEICDGLCLGLARNIADTVLAGPKPHPPVIFAGGVSRNAAVVKHLERLLGCPLIVGELSHLYGATGACLSLLDEGRSAQGHLLPAPILVEELIEELSACPKEEKRYFHAPLSLRLSAYPDFRSEQSRLFVPRVVESALPVEVDVYAALRKEDKVEAILGLDIGSTSTKAILLGMDREVLAGYYTRTAGRPLTAVRSILEALDADIQDKGLTVELRAVGTTGAGRKYIGTMIGADCVLNEITAHARAACELNPATDTIIEIGGQDSKFTVLRNGQVTFAQMNTVCAAGTGSFLEEQAARLGVPLSEYSRRAEGVSAPLASDRCTVFMERDINHYLYCKYTVEEILAAALFSVRENYLLKVASPGLIGDTVCFQGATAKNRALVAVFEQKLNRPIFVSRYCHLTGALGVALSLAESLPERSGFRGIELYRQEVPIRSETCSYCTNHCRLSIAEVMGENVAYGFLCGRDYGTQRFVSSNPTGFDLLRERRKVFQMPVLPAAAQREASPGRPAESARIGLPAALHLFDELPLWKRFFAGLGIAVVASESFAEGIKSGKEIAGAEFCAPVMALHGHARYLAARCDYLFLPVYLEAPKEQRDQKLPGSLRYYCYYTQFAPSLVSVAAEPGLAEKCLMPLVDHRQPAKTKRELLQALRSVAGLRLSYGEVSRAYDRALDFYRARRRELRELYHRHSLSNGDIQVILAGRPYVVLSPAMNKGIPEIFASLGVKSFFQDMIPDLDATGGPREMLAEIRPLLQAFHWHYAARILEVAAFCAQTPGVYPVLITCFKCSPDSFVIEYFKRILDSHRKPYLILQIDEHASSVGYETRIEAGVHSFRNHLRAGLAEAAFAAGPGSALAPSSATRNLVPQIDRRLDGKTLLFPNWDPLSIPLVAANLQSAGIDARVLEEDELSIQKAMRWNTGQCIPLNAITQEMVEYIERHQLDPSKVVLWMARSNWSCNIHLFPHYIKSLLESYGAGMERAGIYLGELTHLEISPLLTVNAYFAYLFGGLLRRLACRIRPYESDPGRADGAVAEGRRLFASAFRGELSKEQALSRVLALFEAIPRNGRPRPKVAIFGDLYVRDNKVLNQDLIRTIEAAGGEVVTTPYSEYVRIIAESYFKKCRREAHYLAWAEGRALLAAVQLAERKYFPYYRSYVSPPDSYHNPRLMEDLARFRLRLEHGGESFENALKILHLLRLHPDITLFVQTSPAFCCPSLVTEAMARHIERVTGVPVVTITYDGTGSCKNDLIAPYLKYPRKPSRDEKK